MMNRSELRGKKLDADCNKAKTTTNECGSDDERVFCFGLNDASTDGLLVECLVCGAYIGNATCEVKSENKHVETCSTCKYVEALPGEYPCVACNQWCMWEKSIKKE